MFNFKKKDKISELEKNLLKKISLFYEMHNNTFVEFSNVNEKKLIIKNIYKILNYDKIPTLYSSLKEKDNNCLKVYRGISAKNIDLLKNYINDFINGNIFYGGRASIYGTGIYTIVGNISNIAQDYASDGGTNDCGVVIESTLQPDSKIIKNTEIEQIRNIIFDKLRKIYKSEVEKFLSILEDDGALAAILGYDAILVDDRNYLVVLNRTKLIVNDMNIDEQMKFINNESLKF